MRGVGAGIAALAVAWVGTAAAVPPERPPLLSADGVELFAFLLHAAGITPADAEAAPSADTILIVLGGAAEGDRRAEDRRLLRRIDQTLRAGGAVLLASDRRGRAVLPGGASVWVAGEPLVQPRGQYVHRGLTACPYVLPVGGARTSVLEVERRLFAGLDRVATNRPSYLIVEAPEGFRDGRPWRPLAILPPGCLADGRPVPTPIVFATGGRWSIDRADDAAPAEASLLVMADHSLFINQMLLEPETDNLELAWRIIRYLRGPQRRRQCLLEYEGKVVESFDRLVLMAMQTVPPGGWPPVPPDSPPVPDLWQAQQKLTEAGNRALAAMQERDVLNTAVLGPHQPAAGRQRRFERLLVVLLSVAAIVALWHVGQQVRSLAHPNRRTSPRQQKASDISRSPPVHELVQGLVRQFFDNLGVRWDQAELPAIRVAATVAEPQRLRDAIRQLWQVARSRRELSLQDWQRLRPTYQWLQQTHAEGEWRFAT